ncbi:MAG: MerR family transcriptional regulator [Actinomycetota bacterium]|nr:MerR family transcriptional regulator [Actinomycetota bacterium]
MDPSPEASTGPIRIGELSRRVGVSVELLRAWERRYELFSPLRTEGGFRLYHEDDERRARRMVEHLAAGQSAAEAARSARREAENALPAGVEDALPAETPGPMARAVGDQLREGLDGLDETSANAALDRLLSGLALDTVVRDVVLPHLHELGDRWERDGDMVIAQEHFASALLRGRLLGLARGWGGGYGPMALLACLPGDQHDLGLICFGLALRANGWRITFLGPDTPLSTISATVDLLRPALVVLTAMVPPGGIAISLLAAIAARAPLALAGAGVDAADARAAGARLLTEDPFTAASRIAAEAVSS